MPRPPSSAAQVLELFLTATVTDAYRPFDQLARAALAMTAQQLGLREVPKAGRARITAELQTLPLHAGVKPAEVEVNTLDALADALLGAR